MFDAVAGAARAGRPRRPTPRPSDVERPAAGRRRHRQRGGARHGRQRHRRRRARRGRRARSCPVPVVVPKRLRRARLRRPRTLVFAISFSGDTEETVEAAPGRRRATAPASWCVDRGRRAGRAGRALGRAARHRARPMPHAAGRHRRGVACRRWSCSSASGLVPRRRRRAIDAAVDQLARRRDQLIVRATTPARRLARRIGRTIPLVYGGGGARRGWPPSAGRASSTRTPRSPAFCQPGARAHPQRDLRLGSARRRHPPGVHAGPAAPRLRAPAGRAPLRPHRRACSTRSSARCTARSGRGRRPPRPAARPGARRRLHQPPRSPPSRASTPARSRSSTDLEAPHLGFR